MIGVDDVRVEVELLVVDVLEHEPEGDGAHGAGDGGSGKRPDQVRVLDGGGGGEGDGGGDGGHEQVDGHDEALHVLGGARVGDAVGGDVAQDFGEGGDDDGDGVVADVDGGDGVFTLGDEVGADGRVVAAWRRLVDVVLQDGEAHGANGAHGKAGGDAGDGTPMDAVLEEEWVDNVVHKRDGYCG